ncbi:hypothetical protein HK102_010371 [Quaeritorhiza haematococci]|nr:hypothetical protein HK102_010371 [Quaeritorhiza haematococci]
MADDCPPVEYSCSSWNGTCNWFNVTMRRDEFQACVPAQDPALQCPVGCKLDNLCPIRRITCVSDADGSTCLEYDVQFRRGKTRGCEVPPWEPDRCPAGCHRDWMCPIYPFSCMKNGTMCGLPFDIILIKSRYDCIAPYDPAARCEPGCTLSPPCPTVTYTCSKNGESCPGRVTSYYNRHPKLNCVPPYNPQIECPSGCTLDDGNCGSTVFSCSKNGTRCGDVFSVKLLPGGENNCIIPYDPQESCEPGCTLDSVLDNKACAPVTHTCSSFNGTRCNTFTSYDMYRNDKDQCVALQDPRTRCDPGCSLDEACPTMRLWCSKKDNPSETCITWDQPLVRAPTKECAVPADAEQKNCPADCKLEWNCPVIWFSCSKDGTLCGDSFEVPLYRDGFSCPAPYDPASRCPTGCTLDGQACPEGVYTCSNNGTTSGEIKVPFLRRPNLGCVPRYDPQMSCPANFTLNNNCTSNVYTCSKDGQQCGEKFTVKLLPGSDNNRECKLPYDPQLYCPRGCTIDPVLGTDDCPPSKRQCTSFNGTVCNTFDVKQYRNKEGKCVDLENPYGKCMPGCSLDEPCPTVDLWCSNDKGEKCIDFREQMVRSPFKDCVVPSNAGSKCPTGCKLEWNCPVIWFSCSNNGTLCGDSFEVPLYRDGFSCPAPYDPANRCQTGCTLDQGCPEGKYTCAASDGTTCGGEVKVPFVRRPNLGCVPQYDPQMKCPEGCTVVSSCPSKQYACVKNGAACGSRFSIKQLPGTTGQCIVPWEPNLMCRDGCVAGPPPPEPCASLEFSCSNYEGKVCNRFLMPMYRDGNDQCQAVEDPANRCAPGCSLDIPCPDVIVTCSDSTGRECNRFAQPITRSPYKECLSPDPKEMQTKCNAGCTADPPCPVISFTCSNSAGVLCGNPFTIALSRVANRQCEAPYDPQSQCPAGCTLNPPCPRITHSCSFEGKICGSPFEVEYIRGPNSDCFAPYNPQIRCQAGCYLDEPCQTATYTCSKDGVRCGDAFSIQLIRNATGVCVSPQDPASSCPQGCTLDPPCPVQTYGCFKNCDQERCGADFKVELVPGTSECMSPYDPQTKCPSGSTAYGIPMDMVGLL